MLILHPIHDLGRKGEWIQEEGFNVRFEVKKLKLVDFKQFEDIREVNVPAWLFEMAKAAAEGFFGSIEKQLKLE
ncbi:TPA: hypothetical protein DF272_05370 [Candidatus Falkowbacteria bacterium]|nr:hypothetical protein [Candidatus Falkowbacteria bacterium]